MRRINYGLQPFATGEESTEIISKAGHFVESANKLSAIVYQCPSDSSYSTFVAVSNGVELKICLDEKRDKQSLSLINQCNPILVNKIDTPTIPYRREYDVVEKLNRSNNTIKCSKCGEPTILYGWMQYCSHCGEKISSDKVKFCPTCKDNTVFSPTYIFCPTCGDKLCAHPNEEISPLEFNTEELLTGVDLHSEYMDYDQIIPQSQAIKDND